MAENNENAIKTFLVEELCDGEEPENLTSTTLIIEEGILDSLGIFETVSWIEETFGANIDAEDVIIDHFRTIADIAAFVDAQTAS